MGDMLRAIQWYLALASFVVCFSLILISTRKLKVAAKYSSWISILILGIGIIVGVQKQREQVQMGIQAELTVEPKNLVMEQINYTTMELRWTTDRADTQYIRYRIMGEGEWMTAYHEPSTAVITEHIIRLRNLEHTVTYEVEIHSAFGTFTTYQDKLIEFTLP